jgi:predicted ester cyclase
MQPRRLVNRFYDEVWNRADTSIIPQLFHEDCVFRGSLGAERRGHEELADYVREVTGALSGYRCDIETLVVERDRAFAKMRFTGRHTGPFLGFAPTGAELAWAGAALFETEGGRIRSLWVLGDLAGLTALLERQAAGG